MPNQLSQQISPYLLQHAENPVDWHPWNAAARELAVREQKLIFLSIGYAACHWCHVMAHESFQDGEIARRLNENFVSIKVDRQERPDLDQLYMEAVQLMTGRGGWPLSVFLTPEGQAFYGGTYWPPRRRHGMAGFDEVLAAVADTWQTHRGEVRQQAQRVTQALRADPWQGAAAELSDEPLRAAETALAQSFDPRLGGFGPAPKFPQPMSLQLLLQRWRRTGEDALLDMVNTTLERMALGGIYDQIGGGFHRYSIDDRWLVPHFEKMLYDNALLAGCYLDAWQATKKPLYERVLRETLDYVLRDLTAVEGGFFSAEDADSEGVEGKFYLWTPAEVAAVLGAEPAATFCNVYDVTATGNFEGRNIPHLPNPLAAVGLPGRDTDELELELHDDRRKLLAARAQRVRPACDDQVLVSWNGLMIDVLARAAAALNEPRWGHAAVKAADFLLQALGDGSGRLRHSWRRGRASGPAFLDDYASLGNALVTLSRQHAEPRWHDEAVRLADVILEQFAAPRAGGFFYTAAESEPLLVRKKDLVDNSAPSGNGLAVTFLLRLAALGGPAHGQIRPADRQIRPAYRQVAVDTFRACMGILRQAPLATGQMLLALNEVL
jgi:uncharacterized protein YyaL (SSP411 family)